MVVLRKSLLQRHPNVAQDSHAVVVAPIVQNVFEHVQLPVCLLDPVEEGPLHHPQPVLGVRCEGRIGAGRGAGDGLLLEHHGDVGSHCQHLARERPLAAPHVHHHGSGGQAREEASYDTAAAQQYLVLLHTAPRPEAAVEGLAELRANGGGILVSARWIDADGIVNPRHAVRELPADAARLEHLVEVVPRQAVFRRGLQQHDASSGSVDGADAASQRGGSEHLVLTFRHETDGHGRAQKPQAQVGIQLGGGGEGLGGTAVGEQ
mmetsp:Transcript_19893/g.35981  ORF Transcript_19893/g.35981 Transcript_19893/m.35981 type:complete len:263 (+) Transcript_19893:323-1111(+)